MEAGLPAPQFGGGRAARRAAAADIVEKTGVCCQLGCLFVPAASIEGLLPANLWNPNTCSMWSLHRTSLCLPARLLTSSKWLTCLAPMPSSAHAPQTAAFHAVGGFNTAVEDFSALITLARNQGAIGGQNRGACRICGQLGHLTKQCRNHLSAHFQAPTTAEAAAAAAASGKPLLPSIPAGPQAEDLSDLSSLSSDGSGSESNSDSGSVRRKRQHKVTCPHVAPDSDQEALEKGPAYLLGCASRASWACAALHVCGLSPWRVRGEREHGDKPLVAPAVRHVQQILQCNI